MIEFLRSLIPTGRPTTADGVVGTAEIGLPPDEILIGDHAPFPIALHVVDHMGLPFIDWPVVSSWVSSLGDDSVQGEAWDACERAWLLRLRAALGPDYRLFELGQSALLSSLEPTLVRVTLEFMERTLKRVTHVLDGVAQAAPWGKDILIVFDNQEKYYEYVSYYYPDDGEHSLSSGMYLGDGCGHFVTVKSDMRTIEPVIAHEMTHGCLSHLPLPLWLNEGIAVNTEWRLVGSGSPLYTPQQLREKHRRFWREKEVQEFWSGKSFQRTDDGNLLSYDLARVMVEQMGKDWDSFQRFVLAANYSDAGASAAEEHLGMDLGTFVAALLEEDATAEWNPKPERWEHAEKP